MEKVPLRKYSRRRQWVDDKPVKTGYCGNCHGFDSSGSANSGYRKPAIRFKRVSRPSLVPGEAAHSRSKCLPYASEKRCNQVL